MPHLGDIVQTTPNWRNNREQEGNNLEDLARRYPATTLAIVVVEAVSSSMPENRGPRLWFPVPGGTMRDDSWGAGSIGDADYLEVVHAVNTPEARAIHAQYPPYQGRDYAWYLQERGLLPPATDAGHFTDEEVADLAEAEEELVEELPTVFAVGDRVRIVNRGDGYDGFESTITEVNGPHHVVLADTPAPGSTLGSLEGGWATSYLELVTPAAAAPVQDLPADQWQVGDILERISDSGGYEDSIPVGLRVSISRAPLTINFQYQLVPGQHAGGVEHHQLFIHNQDFRFVERPLPTAPPVAPTVAATPTTATPASDREWLPGDILELTAVQYTGGVSSRTLMPGAQVRFIRFVGSSPYYGYRVGTIGLEDEYSSSFYEVRWHSRPSSTSAMPVQPFQTGSRIRVAAHVSAPWRGRTGTIIEYRGDRQETNICQMDYGQREHWTNDTLELLQEEAIALPTPEQWQAGDILRRVAATRERERMSIGQECVVERTDRNPDYHLIRMQVPGYGGWWVPKVDLEFVSRPGTSLVATVAPMSKLVRFPCSVDITGVSDELLEEFEQELRKRGQIPYSGSYGNKGTSSDRSDNNLIIAWEGSKFLYHKYFSDAPKVGTLAENWNRLLLALDKKTSKQTVLPFQQKPARVLGLHQLPPYLVVEAQKEVQAEAQKQVLAEWGFTPTTGKYLLLSHNKLTATDNPGVAQAFQDQHQCVRLGTVDDKDWIHTLFTKRQVMLSKSAAQQRFALDVAASGAPLINAFKSFMAHLGYRQQNPELQEGPYILLNGGNIFADQPLTWQYSETYNKRNKLLSLSADKGWEYMVGRISSDNVARPIDQADELDAVPQKGDKVIILNIAVTEGLPETEAELAHHAAGKVYTVKTLLGNNAVIQETGLTLSLERLAVVEKPRGISSGDAVITTAAYGELVPEGKLYTYQDTEAKSSYGVLVDSQGTSFAVPPSHYRVATEAETTGFLLQVMGITLPCVAKITNPEAVGYTQEVVLNAVWPLSNKRLAFWPEQDTDQTAFYEREDFQVVTAVTTEHATIKLLKGSETTQVQVDGHTYALRELEDILALAHA